MTASCRLSLDSCSGHQGESRLRQVQFVLHLAQYFVVDGAHRPAASERFAAPCPASFARLPVARIAVTIRRNSLIVLPNQTCQAMFVPLFNLVVDGCEFVTIFEPRLFEIHHRGFDHGSSCFLFFLFVPGCSRESQRADQRRKRQTLQDQRHQNHAKRKEDDKVPLRKRRPVLQRLGQRKRRCQRKHPRIPVQPTTKICRTGGLPNF